MTVQEAKWYLGSVRSMRVKVRTLENSKEAAWTKATKTTPVMEETGIHGSAEKDLMAQYVIDVEDINQEIIRLKKKIRAAGRQINAMKDPVYSALLYSYYIDALSWDQVADIIGYTPRWIFVLRDRALEEFAKTVQ